jgi:hypothetical protein
VKREVDQLVLATTKRRRKWRKKFKTGKHSYDIEEALLENVWSDLVTQSNFNEEPFTRQYTGLGPGSVSKNSDGVVGTICNEQLFTNPSNTMGLQHYNDEDDSESTRPYGPHPTTSVRMIRKVNAIDMDDDFQLEEAFIDAEILHAKNRRHLAGTNKHKTYDIHGSASSLTASSHRKIKKKRGVYCKRKYNGRNVDGQEQKHRMNIVDDVNNILTMSNH